MSSTPVWANLLMAGGGGAAVVSVAGAWFANRFKSGVRHIASDVVSEKLRPNNEATAHTALKVTDIDRRLVKIEAQFGPNGGGLRQAVNEVQIAVAELRGELKAREKH